MRDDPIPLPTAHQPVRRNDGRSDMDTQTRIDRWVILDECGDTDVAREIDRTFARDAQGAPGRYPVFEDPRERARCACMLACDNGVPGR